MSKIGLLIHDRVHIYSNGIFQNALFIYQCLEKAGFIPQFLCQDTNPSTFYGTDLPLKQISTDSSVFDISGYKAILTISVGLSQDQYDYLKKHKVFIASFLCGNTFMHHMEDFVRGPYDPKSSSFVTRDIPTDEIWTIPSYKYCLDYISLIRDKPAFVVPHLWSSHILAESVVKKYGKSEMELVYNFPAHTSKKLNLLVLEPNIALFKNAWLPIMAAEKIESMDPDVIENIYVFNFPSHSHAHTMIKSLRIHNKIKKFNRQAIPEILTHFNKQSSMPIIVSHQVHNTLNYVYYEALYYGWPLVHNSPDLEDNGYMYKEDSLTGCVNAILHAQLNHHKNAETYKECGRKYLEKIHPYNPGVVSTWKQLFNEGIVRCSAV